MTGPVPFDLLPETAEVDAAGHLVVGGCDLLDLAAEFGTSLFVYDENHLRNRCREAVAAFGDGVAYAGKAFLCMAMARIVHEEGLHVDVASGGELHIVLAAGVPADRIVFHGNNKSTAELRSGLDVGVGRFVIDSFDEIDRLESLCPKHFRPPKVMIRVTPGVKAQTHEFIETGQDDSKFGFGVANGQALSAVERTRASAAMELVGIHSHIGSQVFQVESFAKALEIVTRFSEPLNLPELSVGGGLGVPYLENERAPSIAAWGAMIRSECERLGVQSRVVSEPGRAIVARAAMTLYTVGTIKDLPGIRTYVAVDGGFGDNPRPMLYGSGYTTFLPRAVEAPRPKWARIVGNHCESGDIIVREAPVPDDLAVGDILATPVTGAYGHSMGSNYNKVLRPAVVFVADGDARLVVRRETNEDLLLTDLG